MSYLKDISDKKLYLLLFLLFSIVYILTINDKLTYDSINYAYDISERSLKEQLHPHHILYTPFISLIVKPFIKNLNGDSILYLLQLINSLIASALVTFIYFFLIKLNIEKKLSLMVTFFLGFSYALTFYSHQIEVYLLTVLFSLLALHFLFAGNNGVKKRIFVPLFLALSVLFHQTAVFNLFGVTVFLLFKYRKNTKEFILQLINFIVLPSLIILSVYLVAVHYIFGILNLKFFWKFITSYVWSGLWGNIELSNFYKSIFGFLSTFYFSNEFYFLFAKSGLLNLMIIVILLSFVPLIILIIKIKHNDKSYEVPLMLKYFAFPVIITQSLFNWYWEPENVEFWITLLPSFILIVPFYLQSFEFKSLKKIFCYLISIQILLLMFNTYSGLVKINHYRNFARSAKSVLSKGDYCVSLGNDLVSYLIFYTDAKIIDLVFIERKFLKKGNVFGGSVDSLKSIMKIAEVNKKKFYFESQVIENSDLNKDGLNDYKFLKYINQPPFRKWLDSLNLEKVNINGYSLYLLKFN